MAFDTCPLRNKQQLPLKMIKFISQTAGHTHQLTHLHTHVQEYITLQDEKIYWEHLH